MTKQEKKSRKPSKKDLEFLAYALPWSLLDLLPKKHRDRDALITGIITLWELIREEK